MEIYFLLISVNIEFVMKGSLWIFWWCTFHASFGSPDKRVWQGIFLYILLLNRIVVTCLLRRYCLCLTSLQQSIAGLSYQIYFPASNLISKSHILTKTFSVRKLLLLTSKWLFAYVRTYWNSVFFFFEFSFPLFCRIMFKNRFGTGINPVGMAKLGQ